MNSNKSAIYQDLAALHECYDSLQKLVQRLGYYLDSASETWRTLEIQRAELSRQVTSNLAALEGQEQREYQEYKVEATQIV